VTSQETKERKNKERKEKTFSCKKNSHYPQSVIKL
jgi:hypothetical protein